LSRLLVHELETELSQTVVPTRNVRIRAIYLGLLRYNTTTGTLTLRLEDTLGELNEASNAVNISALGSDTYVHGLFRFDLQASIRKDTTYKLTLTSGGGYSYSSSAFVGWKSDFDFTVDEMRRVPVSYSPSKGYQAPLEYLVVEKKLLRKGSP